jgi:hypothetical protein
MTHLFVPPSVRRFFPKRVVPGPSMRHVGLEYDLVESLRPSLVVDLGAGDCASFFAYCQSMLEHDVDGSAYAIDTWDDSRAPNPHATFDAVSGYGRASYAGLSYFVRMAPCDALRLFDENTIDVLRVDGARPDVIAGADVEAWFHRVKPGGIIAWHGAAAEPSLWSLLSSRSPSVVFAGGRGGLGLLRKGDGAPTAELLRALFADDERTDVERFYKHVHEHLELGRLLAAAAGTA